jgi:hypothetical protein
LQLNESPLHFACKFGHAEVVGILASHPKTNKNLFNRDGKTPADVGIYATIYAKISTSLNFREDRKIVEGCEQCSSRRFICYFHPKLSHCSDREIFPEGHFVKIVLA